MTDLGKFPPELLLKIYGELDFSDQIRFSAANRLLRDLGVGQMNIFRALRFTWSKPNTCRSALLVATNHPDKVRELVLIASPPWSDDDDDDEKNTRDNDGGKEAEGTQEEEDDDDDDEDVDEDDVIFDDDKPVLTGSCKTLLTISLPNLERISIAFPKSYGWRMDDMYFDDGERTNYEKLNNTLINRIIEALSVRGSENKPLSALRITNFPPHASLQCQKEGWRSLLGQLEAFELSLYGSCREMSLSRQWNYGNFISMHKMAACFQDHLRSVKRFAFGPSHSCMIEPAYPPGWSADKMPAVEEITLSNVFISEQLIIQLASHARASGGGNLSLTLDDPSADIDGMTWAQFFDRVIAEKIPLSSFSVNFAAEVLELYEDDLPEETLKAVMAKRDENPLLEIWRYGRIDDKYGYYSQSCLRTSEEFLAGNDEAAYKRLMKMIRMTKKDPVQASD